MYQQNLELLYSARAGTLRLCSSITQAQSEFAPPERWSAGEVLHHLLLSDCLYQRNFGRLIQLQKSGQRPVLRANFTDLNPSIAYIPKSLLPLLEIPFTVVNL